MKEALDFLVALRSAFPNRPSFAEHTLALGAYERGVFSVSVWLSPERSETIPFPEREWAGKTLEQRVNYVLGKVQERQAR